MAERISSTIERNGLGMAQQYEQRNMGRRAATGPQFEEGLEGDLLSDINVPDIGTILGQWDQSGLLVDRIKD